MPAEQQPVVVAGGGWAGLAAAVTLSSRGVPVTLLESARQLGGRARRVSFSTYSVDNGQHLMLGAYQHMLALLEVLGLQEADLFLRTPLHLELLGPNHRHVTLSAPRLPAPIHLSTALLSCRGLKLSERLRALMLSLKAWLTDFRIEQDRPVADWLADNRQPANVIEALWEPICLGALNTPLEQASTRVFLRVLRDTFAHRRADSDMLFPRHDLGHLFPDPAMAYIEARGGAVRLSQRVSALEIVDNALVSLKTADQAFPARHLVLATPPAETRRLISGHSGMTGLGQQLGGLDYLPICTVYLSYPAHIGLHREAVGFMGHTAQWLFDRRIYGQPGLMAVVISGPGEHMQMNNEQLEKRVRADIRAHYPDWPEALECRVIREKRATFACTPAANALRPGHTTGVDGLWLAGDYVQTGYPATLEGALRSGVECAHAILDELA